MSELKMMQEKIRSLTEQQMQEMLRRVLGPSRRVLEGIEYEQVWMLLQLLEPIHQSNNQRTWTDEYLLNGKRYDVTFGLGDKPEIEVYE